MNWKLVIALSMFGLAMAIATVYIIPSNIEIYFWLVIFGICAWLIQKNATGKYFLHGFMVSLFNCVWITSAHIILSTAYLANHKEEAEAYSKLYDKFHLSVHQTMLISGPIIGIFSGLFLGLFSMLAVKIFKKVG